MIYQKFLEETISVLIDSYPYFGCLVQRCSINWTDRMPTACVRVLPSGNLEMVVNPEFFCQLTPKERVGLVKHEMYHLICDHITSAFGLDPQIANIAMDTAINQFIPYDYLPPGALLPDNVVQLENRIREKKGEELIKLDPMQAFPYYYNILKQEFDRQNIKKMQNPHQFEGQLDANNQPKQKSMTPEEQKQQQEQMKKMLAELLEQESAMEDEKNKLTQTKLTAAETQELNKIIATQKELVNTQKEIQDLLAKISDDSISALNKAVTEKLVAGEKKLSEEV